MKRLFAIPLAAMVFACGAPIEDSELNALRTRRDSLKNLQTDIEAEIEELDAMIAMKDTTVERKRTLVTTARLEPQNFIHRFKVHGVVEASQNINIMPEMPGTIKSIRVSEGQEVRQGQVLATVDTDVISKSIKEAEAGLELATTMFDKQKELWDQKIGSEVQYLQAKSQKEQMETRIATLKEQVAMGVITAPFNGRVDEIFPKVGEMANPAFPVMRLVNLSDSYLTGDVSERYLQGVAKGSKVEVHFPSLKETTVGEVIHKGQYINPNNRTFKVMVDIDDPEGLFVPNLLAVMHVTDVQLDTAALVADSLVVVDENIIQQDARGQEFLFTIDRSGAIPKAKRVDVRSVSTYNSRTLISGPLAFNDEILNEGARGLRNGAEIEIKK